MQDFEIHVAQCIIVLLAQTVFGQQYKNERTKEKNIIQHIERPGAKTQR